VPPQTRFRALTTLTLVALSGLITGVAAAGHAGPFAVLGGAGAERTVGTQLPSAPLRATDLFPAPTKPPALHEVIVVTDPAHTAPRVTLSTPSPRPSSDATPEPEDTPGPSASPSPSPKPCDDDGCQGGGD
jgi:hypothetical protein